MNLIQKNDKKVAFVLVNGLPLPDVKGGAIEYLLTLLLNCNEKYHFCDMDFFCIYNKEAKEADHYKKSKIKYVPFGFIHRAKYKLKKIVFPNKCEPIWSSYYWDVYQECCKEKYDLIIFEGGPTDPIFYRRFSNLAPICYHLHFNGYPENCKSSDAFDYLIGVSQYVVDDWKKRIPEQSSYVVKNGIDLVPFKDSNIIDKKELGIDENDFVVLYVGRLIEVKGVYELLCALQSIKDEHVKLLIIGSANFSEKTNTEYEQKVKSKITELGDRVVFTGYVEHSHLPQYYHMADIQVIPSKWEEAAGLVAIEGMASGLPMVVTKSGGMVEYVNDKCALIIDKGTDLIENIKNGIIFLKDHPEKRKKMSEEGRLNAEKYSDIAFYKNMVNVINDIVKKEEKAGINDLHLGQA